tara:strand:+ start:4546 stop:5676 length:1131 start_codon:yes stop_codon:yes gene_type:complete
MKIAILVGPKDNKYVSTWNDTIPISKNRPWLTKVPLKDRRDEGGRLTLKGGWVRIDEANAWAFKHYCKGHEVSIIRISQTSYKKLDGFDFIIWHWVDMLVEPRIKKFESDGVPMLKLHKLYAKLGSKMYPPLKWADTIYDKCRYYDYLNKKKLPIGETQCIEKRNFVKNPSKSVKELKERFTWTGPTFAKPASGTDSLDIGVPNSISTNRKMIQYVRNTFKNPNYSKIVFQKYYSDFEVTVPQMRTYWVGKSFKYAILEDTTGKGIVVRPRMALVGKYKRHFKTAFKIAREALKTIQKDFFGKMPLLLTRVDFGCCLREGNFDDLFINEIEFNPGLYLYKLGETAAGKYTGKRPLFEVDLAKQMCKAVKKYEKLNK